jgi:hypothetical protein
MAYQALELGTAADDGTGDSLRVGGDKINDNFVEFYTALGTGTAISSGISASATIVTLVAPIITEIDSGSTITLDATTDIILDADGGDIFFKDAGTTFGSATNTSGNLIIKSGTTTAATFAGANVTLAGTLGVGAITTTGAFKGADGYTIGNASVAAVMTLASTGIVTFVDDIVLKDAATIGVTSSTSAITIASTGIVTFVDDILLKDAGTIGNASVAAVMTLASTGIVTFADDILIKDAGTIGNASVAAVMTLASTGIVTFVDDIILKDAATIGVTSSHSAMTIASTGIVTFVDDILLKDAGTIGNASVAAVMTLASTGIVTFVDDIILKDAATIGVTSSTGAIAIASTGIVTFVDDILIKDVGTIGSASTPAALTIAANGTLTTAAGIELGHASDTTLARSAAGIMTVEGSVVKTAGTETIWVPASAMYPCSTNGCATLAQVETTAQQPEFKVLDFDKDSDEFAQFTVAFPKSWNAGTVTFRVYWVGLAATTGVAWTLAGRSVADNAEAIGAFGTAVVVQDDSQGDATEVLISAISGAVTITGVADDTLTFFQISRDISDGNDDMAGDARLTGIQIFYTTNATNDA